MKQFFRNNGLLILIAAVLLAAVLAVGSLILGGNPVSDVLGVLATPFRSLSSTVAGWVEDQYDRAFRYDALEEAYDELKRQLAELKEKERKYDEAIRENKQYKDLLGLAEEREDFVFEEATITQRSTSSWEWSATLNKGSRHDVEKNDCVVDQYGNLVGIVTEVDYNSCVMSFLTDGEVEIGGRVARVDENAVLEGDFTLMQDGRLKLSYLEDDTPPIWTASGTCISSKNLIPQGNRPLPGTVDAVPEGGLSLFQSRSDRTGVENCGGIDPNDAPVPENEGGKSGLPSLFPAR